MCIEHQLLQAYSDIDVQRGNHPAKRNIESVLQPIDIPKHGFAYFMQDCKRISHYHYHKLVHLAL